MPRNSPPSHRHDGTSPLPLGMDWSPPPKRWDGRNTVWPHNHQTGWSYCVMIPSWSIQTDPDASHESLNPIVFYRIHVGIQSPQGISTNHELLRRFSDFLKLHSALKKAFPRKDIPLAPPKHAFLRINSSRVLLEERRHALAEWMQKLLSDIALSRSAQVASFLELEAAARSAFNYANNHPTESSSSTDAAATSPSTLAQPSSSVPVSNNSTVTSVMPYASLDSLHENANETSDFGISRKGKIQVSQTGAEDVSLVHNNSANIAIGNGIMGESFFDQPEDFGRVKLNDRKEFLAPHREIIGGGSRDRMESISGQDHDKHHGHARKLSAESFESDISSIRGSELSFAGVTNSIWDGPFDVVPINTEIVNATDGPGTQFLENSQIVLPYDQRYRLNRVLVTMQRRLVTAKTDMEDLIARLNQEMAVKEYLTTKVKDLEIELEATEQKSKENLQQAILIERERITEMQWDMDELRRKHSEMETKLLSEENERSYAESEKKTAKEEKDCLQQELDSKQEELVNMQKRLEELELKSKADIKVLVKEVKFLRKSQAELKEMLNQSVKEKTELEGVLHKEMRRWSNAKSANKTFLHECRVLRDRLQECSINFLTDEEDKFTIDDSSLSDALDLLATSDNRIGLLLAEAQLLARNDEVAYTDDDVQTMGVSESPNIPNGDASVTADDDEIRKTLTDVFIDNLKLRKQVNNVIRRALSTVTKQEKDDGSEVPSRKTVLNRFLER